MWSVLGAVKTESSKFGGLLEKVQKNIQTAGDQLEEVMGKRTRAIERRLSRLKLYQPKSHKRFFLLLIWTMMNNQPKQQVLRTKYR